MKQKVTILTIDELVTLDVPRNQEHMIGLRFTMFTARVQILKTELECQKFSTVTRLR
jgi:hypothetical protein